MAAPEDFGTETCGGQSQTYCCHCYQNGSFGDDLTLEEMIEICAPYVVEAGEASDLEGARAMLQSALPQLKRWASA